MGAASFSIHCDKTCHITSLAGKFLQGGVVLVLAAADHLEAVLVGEDGEVGLRLEDENLAAFGILGNALHAAHGDEYAALVVGVGEELVAEAVVEGFGAFVRHLLAAVLEVYDGLCFALRGEASYVAHGDELGVGGEEAHLAVAESTVIPGLVDGHVAVLEEAVGTVAEAVLVEALADEEAVVVVLHKASLEAAADVGAGDVALLADALPPAAMTVIVGPVGHLGGVALGGVYDVEAVFDAHLVFGLLNEAAVLVEELPLAVAVALVVGAGGQQVTLLVESLVAADAAGLGIGVAYAHGAVVVVIGEDAGLKAVGEGAFVDFGAVLVGAYPMPLAAALLVNLVLSHSADGGQQHSGGEE